MIAHLNIVFIGRLSFPNGIASTKRRRYIVDYLNAQNIGCKIICLQQKESSRFNNPQHGFYGIAEYISFSDLYFSNHKGKLKYFDLVKRQLKSFYKKDKKNVLIFNTNLSVDALPFFMYAKKIGYKIIFDQVETSYTAKGVNILLKSRIYAHINNIVSHWAYKNSSGSFVISEALYEANMNKYQKPLCLLPNSTPILCKSKKDSFSNPIKILYVGTFTPKDGVYYLIKAFEMLALTNGNICLQLVGKGIEKDMNDIYPYIHGNKKIYYYGYVSDEQLVDIMLDSDILTMTRTNSVFANYGFPFKLSEYLATGNPVLATRVSDVTNYLQDKVNAFLAEAEDIESIYNALKYIVEHEKESIKIGARGIKVVEEFFNVNTNGEKFVNFIKNI